MNRINMILATSVIAGLVVASSDGAPQQRHVPTKSTSFQGKSGTSPRIDQLAGRTGFSAQGKKTIPMDPNGKKNNQGKGKGKGNDNGGNQDKGKGKGKGTDNGGNQDKGKGIGQLNFGRGVILDKNGMPRVKGFKLKPTDKKTIEGFTRSAKLTKNEQGALQKTVAGQKLAPADRTSLTNLLAQRNRPDLTPEVREAITQALVADAEAEFVARRTRYLNVHNAGNEGLRVWVQYHAYTDKNQWVWFPTAPDVSPGQAVIYELRPGQVASLKHESWTIHAARVRTWARTASGKMMNQYQNEDLVLVPELDDAGEPCYYAAEMETYTFSIGASTKQ